MPAKWHPAPGARNERPRRFSDGVLLSTTRRCFGRCLAAATRRITQRSSPILHPAHSPTPIRWALPHL